MATGYKGTSGGKTTDSRGFEFVKTEVGVGKYNMYCAALAGYSRNHDGSWSSIPEYLQSGNYYGRSTSGNYTVKGSIEPYTYWTVSTTNPSSGGTVSGGGNFDDGAMCTITATPSSGYVVESIDGYPVSEYSTGAKTRSFHVYADRTGVTATFLKYYTVRLHKNTGDGATYDQSPLLYGTTYNLRTLNELGWTLPGYKFFGWSTNSDGTGTLYSDGQAVSNLTSTAGKTVHLYATWGQYTVSYDGNGGTPTESGKAYFGYITLANASRPGYAFAGWLIEGQSYGAGATYYLDHNVTATAQWATNGVWFDTRGGSDVVSPQYGVVTLPSTTRNGYWFTGWFDSPSGGNKVGNAGDTFTPSGTTALYAQWSDRLYELGYDNVFMLSEWTLGGFAYIDSAFPGQLSWYLENDVGALVIHGKATDYADIYTAWTRDASMYWQGAYVFPVDPNFPLYEVSCDVGFYKDDGGFSPTDSLATNAFGNGVGATRIWMFFFDDGGNYIANADAIAPCGTYKGSGVYRIASDVAVPQNARFATIFFEAVLRQGERAEFTSIRVIDKYRAGFAPAETRFPYWYADNYQIPDAAGRTYNARHYTSVDPSADPMITPQRTGYTFTGWYRPDQGLINGNSVVNLGSSGVYSQWTPNTYTVTLQKEGGSGGPDSVEATFDAAMPQIVTPTRPGYTFLGYSAAGGNYYFYNADGTSARPWDYPDNADIYAQWTPHSYTVVFNENGGSGSMQQQSFTYDVEQALRANGFSRMGFTFGGWNTAADGSGVAYAASEVIKTQFADYPDGSTITLYAQWNGSPYRIELDLDGGAIGAATGTVEIGANVGRKSEIPLPQKSNFRLVGWTVAGHDASIARWTDSPTDPPDTPIADNAITSPGAIYVLNLVNVGNATVNMKARWERIVSQVSVDNSAGTDFSLSITGSEGDVSVFVAAGGSGSFTARAGAVYTVVATMAGASFTDSVRLPKAIGGLSFSRRANTTPAEFAAESGAIPADGEPMEWTTAARTVAAGVGANPASETLPRTLEFADDATADIRITASETNKSDFITWSGIDGAEVKGGGDYDANPIVLTNFSKDAVSIAAQYQLAKNTATAVVDAASAAVFAGLSGCSVSANVTYGGTTAGSVEVSYGEKATWSVSVTDGDAVDPQPTSLPAGYAFAGWYASPESANPVSTDQTLEYSVLSATTLYAKFTSTLEATWEGDMSGASGELGYLVVDGEEVVAKPHSAAFLIGRRVELEAVPYDSVAVEGGGAKQAFFAGWFDGATHVGTQKLPYPSRCTVEIGASRSLCAFFRDTEDLFWLSVYGRNAATKAYEPLATATVSSPNARAATRAEFEGGGLALLDDDGEGHYGCVDYSVDPNVDTAAFASVEGIDRVVVAVAPRTDPPMAVGRVFVKSLSGGGETQIAEGRTSFAVVVGGDTAVIVEWGSAAYRRLFVRVANEDAGGKVRVGNAARDVRPFDNFAESGLFECGTDFTAIALPSNGYRFAGWYSGYDGGEFSGLVSESPVYSAPMEAWSGQGDDPGVTLYAKFERESAALYRWEGSDRLKRLRWRSKVYALSKPVNLTSVRVDSTGYPIARFKAESFSAPDASATSTVDFNRAWSQIKNQSMRRLPQRRPERYFQVEVQNDAEVDAIIIGTSGEGLAT